MVTASFYLPVSQVRRIDSLANRNYGSYVSKSAVVRTALQAYFAAHDSGPLKGGDE